MSGRIGADVPCGAPACIVSLQSECSGTPGRAVLASPHLQCFCEQELGPLVRRGSGDGAGIPCWCNRLAKEGRYNLDPDIKFFATPPVHGSLAEVSHTTNIPKQVAHSIYGSMT